MKTANTTPRPANVTNPPLCARIATAPPVDWTGRAVAVALPFFFAPPLPVDAAAPAALVFVELPNVLPPLIDVAGVLAVDRLVSLVKLFLPPAPLLTVAEAVELPECLEFLECLEAAPPVDFANSFWVVVEVVVTVCARSVLVVD